MQFKGLTVMSKYHKMDPKEYPNRFRCLIIRISKNIWIPHIYQTNIQIYSHIRNGTNKIQIVFKGHFIQIFINSYWTMVVVTWEKDHSWCPLNKFVHWIFRQMLSLCYNFTFNWEDLPQAHIWDKMWRKNSDKIHVLFSPS